LSFYRINLVDGFVPRKQHPYRITEQLRSEVDRQIDELLAKGKIQKSVGPFGHPLVCVVKKCGGIRICTNMRVVNSGKINDAYPILRIDEMLKKVSPSKYISLLDCSQGFFQQRIYFKDIYKTAFVTHRGLYEWICMPFGLKCSSSSFQYIMLLVLAGLKEFVGVKIDDTVVHLNSWEAHLRDLEATLKAFQSAGVTIKLSKCTFASHQVEFVCHFLGSGCIRVIQSNVDAINRMSEPTNN